MKKVLKLFAAVFLIGMFALVMIAIFRQETYPSEMKNTLGNEVLSSYCDENGMPPAAYTHESIDDFDYKGVFQAKYLTYIPEAGQVQISVRYGTLLFEALKEKYELSELPTLYSSDVSFKLRTLKVSDGAFSNSDNSLDEDEILDERIIDKSSSLDLTQGRHNYSRLVFDGVDFDKYNCFYLDLYYKDEAEPFTVLIIYHEDAAARGESVELTVADCKK